MVSWFFASHAFPTPLPAQPATALALGDDAFDSNAGQIVVRPSTRSKTGWVVAATFVSSNAASAWANRWAKHLQAPVLVRPADAPGAWFVSVPCRPPSPLLHDIYSQLTWDITTGRGWRYYNRHAATTCEHCDATFDPDADTHCPGCGISLDWDLIVQLDRVNRCEAQFTA